MEGHVGDWQTGGGVEQVDDTAGDHHADYSTGGRERVGPFELARERVFGDGLFVDGEVAVGEGVEGIAGPSGAVSGVAVFHWGWLD